jgi:hypothetical protein
MPRVVSLSWRLVDLSTFCEIGKKDSFVGSVLGAVTEVLDERVAPNEGSVSSTH